MAAENERLGVHAKEKKEEAPARQDVTARWDVTGKQRKK